MRPFNFPFWVTMMLYQRVVKDTVQVTLLKRFSTYEGSTLLKDLRFSYTRFGIIDSIRELFYSDGSILDSNLYVFAIDGQSSLPTSYIKYQAFAWEGIPVSPFALTYSNELPTSAYLGKNRNNY